MGSEMKKLFAALFLLLSCGLASATTYSLFSDNSTPPLSLVRSVPGPLAVNLSSYPVFYEFSRSGFTEKGAIGALGSFEMNVSYNMDYTTGTHRLYDQSKDAYWLALNQFGLYMQYAPASTAGGDVWDSSGNQYGFFFSKAVAKFNGTVQPFVNAGGDLGAAGVGFRRLYIDSGTAQTVGTVTLNKATGRVFIGAGQNQITLYNAYCTPNARVFANVSTQDAAAFHAQVTPGNGSCQIMLNAFATNQVAVDFFIVSTE